MKENGEGVDGLDGFVKYLEFEYLVLVKTIIALTGENMFLKSLIFLNPLKSHANFVLNVHFSPLSYRSSIFISQKRKM